MKTKVKVRLITITLLLIIFLSSTANADLGTAAFGFAQDMSLSLISAQNPIAGKFIVFLLNEKAALTNELFSVLPPEISTVFFPALQIVEGTPLQAVVVGEISDKAKGAIKGFVYEKMLSPTEQKFVSNLEKYKAYIEEAFAPDPKTGQRAIFELDKEGNTILKDSKGNVVMKIPKGYQPDAKEGKLVLTVGEEGTGEFVFKDKVKGRFKKGATLEMEGEEITKLHVIAAKGSRFVLGENRELTIANDNTEVSYEKEKITVHGKNIEINYGDFRIFNEEDKISFSKDKIEGKSFVISNYNKYFYDQITISTQRDFTSAKITNDGFIIEADSAIFFADNNVEIKNSEEILLGYKESDISKYKAAVRIFDNGIEAHSNKGKIELTALYNNKLFGTFEGQNVKLEVNNGDAIKIVKEERKAPTLFHFSSENGFTEIENGKIKIKLDDKKDYYLYPAIPGKSSVALDIESDAIKFDEKILLAEDNNFRIERKEDILTFFGLKRSSTVLLIAHPSEEELVSFKNKFSNINFKDAHSWSIDEFTRIKKMVEDFSSKTPALSEYVNSIKLEYRVGARAFADSEGNIGINPKSLSEDQDLIYTLIHEATHLKHHAIDPKLNEMHQPILEDYLKTMSEIAELSTAKERELAYENSKEKFIERINNIQGSSAFTKKWKEIAGPLYLKNCEIEEAMGFRCLKWSDDTKGPRNGFIKPYGATNIFEDVATMTQEAYSNPKFVLEAASKDERIKEKVKLLCKEKFVTNEVCKNV